MAFCTIFLLGYIAAPPTIGFSAEAVPTNAAATIAAAVSSLILFILRPAPLRHGHRVILCLRENAPVRTANRLSVLDTDGGVDSFGITICCERENPGKLSAPVASRRRTIRQPKKGQFAIR